MILLDTCTLLWLVSDPRGLSDTAKKLVLETEDSIFVSSISAFEIGLKTSRNRLKLPLPVQGWFEKALAFHEIQEIPVDSQTAILSTQLPPLHRDPSDRLIIATSQIHGLTLVTPDPLIRQYPGIKVAW